MAEKHNGPKCPPLLPHENNRKTKQSSSAKLSWSVITSVSVLLVWVPAPVTKMRTRTSPQKQEAEVWDAYQCGPEDTLAPSSDSMTNTEAALVKKGTQ